MARTHPLLRRRRAAYAAYASGFILLVTGGTGAVGAVQFSHEVVERLSPKASEFLLPFFIMAMVIAMLGGVTVMVGASILRRHNRILGKVLIAFGAGVGLIPFALSIALFIATGGDPLRYLVSTSMTLQGVAALLAIYAQATG